MSSGNPFVAKCHECGWERPAPTLETARQMAAIHTRVTSCLFTFGYPGNLEGINVTIPKEAM
jgi:hypothetical protein